MLPPVLLDGSYVSKKARPNNIILLLKFSNLSDEKQWEGQILFQRKAELLG